MKTSYLIAGLLGLFLNMNNLSAQSLSPNPSSVSLSPTRQDHTYSLQQTSDITDSNSWSEVSNQRGNGSNLVFEVDNSQPVSFFKTRSDYSPVNSPIQIELPHDPHQATPTIMPFIVTNYTTNNLKVRMQYEEVMNVYGLAYSNSLSRAVTNNISPGDTSFNDTAFWAGRSGTGGTVYGQINVQVVK